MTFIDSLGIDVFGLTIVFSVLVALSLVIKVISILMEKTFARNNKESLASSSGEDRDAQQAQYSDGELKLYDVDEKTAAIIMAIVSDESKIPLSQLYFKSIRLMK